MAAPNLYPLACARCKRQKVKCDRTLPGCNNCHKSSQDCVYPAAANKPGPKPGTSRRRARTPDTDDHSPGGGPIQKYPKVFGAPLSPKSPEETHEDISGGCPLVNIIHGVKPSEDDSVMSVAEYAHKDPTDGGRFIQAMDAIGISAEETLTLVDTYFANFTSFGLFHKPTFHHKITSIKSTQEAQALLLSIFAVSRRYVDVQPDMPFCANNSTDDLMQRAYELNRTCIEQCGDEAPQLHLLQSYFLVTFLRLAQGVRSLAYRMIGDCVRIAYELELHLEDGAGDVSNLFARDPVAKTTDPVEREERRRTWWAVWEAEVFAANMRRQPCTIDATANRTALPCADDDWYAGRAPPSCLLAVDPVRRWRDLAACGNKSIKAWQLLIYSYKHDAFVLSTSTSAAAHQLGVRLVPGDDDGDDPARARDLRDTVENCLRCAHMAMPQEFVFSERYLSFGARAAAAPGVSQKALDAARYNIHLMMHLAIFMLYRREVYKSATDRTAGARGCAGNVAGNAATQVAWDRYLHAAATVSSLARNSAPTHHMYVNPWLANVFWYSAAAQVVTGLFGPPTANRQLIASNFSLLRSTLARFVAFWGLPAALLANLDSLGSRVVEMLEGPSASIDKLTAAVGAAGGADGVAARKQGVAEREQGAKGSPLDMHADLVAFLGDPARTRVKISEAETTTTDGQQQQGPTPEDDAGASFQPDMFQSMLTDEFMAEMIGSTNWGEAGFNLDDLFLDPIMMPDAAA